MLMLTCERWNCRKSPQYNVGRAALFCLLWFLQEKRHITKLRVKGTFLLSLLPLHAYRVNPAFMQAFINKQVIIYVQTRVNVISHMHVCVQPHMHTNSFCEYKELLNHMKSSNFTKTPKQSQGGGSATVRQTHTPCPKAAARFLPLVLFGHISLAHLKAGGCSSHRRDGNSPG